jgi:hypothetical protein
MKIESKTLAVPATVRKLIDIGHTVKQYGLIPEFMFLIFEVAGRVQVAQPRRNGEKLNLWIT